MNYPAIILYTLAVTTSIYITVNTNLHNLYYTSGCFGFSKKYILTFVKLHYNIAILFPGLISLKCHLSCIKVASLLYTCNSPVYIPLSCMNSQLVIKSLPVDIHIVL